MTEVSLCIYRLYIKSSVVELAELFHRLKRTCTSKMPRHRSANAFLRLCSQSQDLGVCVCVCVWVCVCVCVFRFPAYWGHIFKDILPLQGLDTQLVSNMGHCPCNCTTCCLAVPSLARAHPPWIPQEFRRDLAKTFESAKTTKG